MYSLKIYKTYIDGTNKWHICDQEKNIDTNDTFNIITIHSNHYLYVIKSNTTIQTQTHDRISLKHNVRNFRRYNRYILAIGNTGALVSYMVDAHAIACGQMLTRAKINTCKHN